MDDTKITKHERKLLTEIANLETENNLLKKEKDEAIKSLDTCSEMSTKLSIEFHELIIENEKLKRQLDVSNSADTHSTHYKSAKYVKMKSLANQVNNLRERNHEQMATIEELKSQVEKDAWTIEGLLTKATRLEKELRSLKVKHQELKHIDEPMHDVPGVLSVVLKLQEEIEELKEILASVLP